MDGIRSLVNEVCCAGLMDVTEGLIVFGLWPLYSLLLAQIYVESLLAPAPKTGREKKFTLYDL